MIVPHAEFSSAFCFKSAFKWRIWCGLLQLLKDKKKKALPQCNRYPSSKAFTVSKKPLNCCIAVGITVNALVSWEVALLAWPAVDMKDAPSDHWPHQWWSDILSCPGTRRCHYLYYTVEKRVMRWMTQQLIALPAFCWGRYFTKDHTTCHVQVQRSPLPTTGCVWTRCFGHSLEMRKWAGRRVDAQVSHWWTVEPGIYFYHFHVVSDLRNSRTAASKLC